MSLEVCGLASPPTQKQRHYRQKAWAEGLRFQRRWEIVCPSQIIFIKNQAISLPTPNWPRPDLCDYLTWCHKKDEMFILIIIYWNSQFSFPSRLHDRALDNKQDSYFYQWKFSPRIYIKKKKRFV